MSRGCAGFISQPGGHEAGVLVQQFFVVAMFLQLFVVQPYEVRTDELSPEQLWQEPFWSIVARLWPRDQHHAWAQAHFKARTEPFVTCEAVISESLFLLERVGNGKEALCGLLEREIVRGEFLSPTNLPKPCA